MIDTQTKERLTKAILLRMEASLFNRLTALCEKRKVKRETFIRELIAKRVDQAVRPRRTVTSGAPVSRCRDSPS